VLAQALDLFGRGGELLLQGRVLALDPAGGGGQAVEASFSLTASVIGSPDWLKASIACASGPAGSTAARSHSS
jgi:hypothetical protein